MVDIIGGNSDGGSESSQWLNVFDSQEMSREQGQRDFLEQQRWAEIRDTIAACVEANVIPIINENDTTNTDGMRFGDNDNLAALTAVQLGAAGVFLFTDVDYLYTAGAQAVPVSRHATCIANFT